LFVLQQLNQAEVQYANFFASSYLNVFVTKRCKNFTFADQVFFYSTKFNKCVKIVQQSELKV